MLALLAIIPMMIFATACGGTGNEGGGTYRLSVSETLDEPNFVYEANGVTIWHLVADGPYAAWVEWDGLNSYDYKFYDKEENSVETAKKLAVGFENIQIGLYDSVLYYNLIDYDNNTISVEACNLKDMTSKSIHKTKFMGGSSAALEVKDGVLISFFKNGDGNMIYQRYIKEISKAEKKRLLRFQGIWI